MKPSIDLKNDIQKLTLTEKIESTVYDTTGLIGPTTANQQCEKMMEEHVEIEEDPTLLATTYFSII